METATATDIESRDAEEDGFPPATNPAPPEEADEEASLLRSDAIGSTMYSERGVLRTLLALNQALPTYQQESGGKLLELEEGLEEQLCQLWDMTTEPDVAVYLLDGAGLARLVAPVLDTCRCPRLLEIVVGILANCASCTEPRLFIQQPELPGQLAAAVIANPCQDPLALREALRLLQTAACSQPRPQCTLSTVQRLQPVLLDMLQNSLSAPLLQQTLALLCTVSRGGLLTDSWLQLMSDGPRPLLALLDGLTQLLQTPPASPPTYQCEPPQKTCLDTLELAATLFATSKDKFYECGYDSVISCLRAVSAACVPTGDVTDLRVAAYLLWLATCALRYRFCTDSLELVLRFCLAVRSHAAQRTQEQERRCLNTGGEQGDTGDDETRTCDGGEQESPGAPSAAEDVPQESGGDGSPDAERLELEARLVSTVTVLAAEKRPETVQFLQAADAPLVSLFVNALEQRDPQLAHQLRECCQTASSSRAP